MKAHLKQLAERASGHSVWIDGAAPLPEVRALIARLRPAGTRAPLVRVGSEGDGGYLVPDDLSGIVACLSPGVSDEVGFDAAMAERGMDVYMADASVKGPPVAHPRFHFQPKFLDVVDDAGNLRLDSWCRASAPDGDLMLQMDIEGAEWRVLLDTSPETLARFRIMVIEFHDLRQIFGRFSFGLIRAVFTKLLKTHAVVHIHPNNIRPAAQFDDLVVPELMEFTFYRRDRDLLDAAPAQMPHPLDADCVAGKPSLVLPDVWWRG